MTFEVPLDLSFTTLSFNTQDSFGLDDMVTRAARVPDGGTTAALLELATARYNQWLRWRCCLGQTGRSAASESRQPWKPVQKD